jgi:exodeoxyribonuclease V alpha subunit
MYNPQINNHLVGSDEGLTSLDCHFAGFICELAHINEPWLFMAAALASNAVQTGHVCIDLSSTPYFDRLKLSINEWIALLKSTSVIGPAGENKPLILENGRLYLHKYWSYEKLVAETLRDRAWSIYEPKDLDKINGSLLRLWSDATNLQGYCALVALMKNLAIISGGPGTGKTTTVAKIVAFLMETLNINLESIALAAPTGKAAARLKQSFVRAFHTLDVSPDVKQKAETDLTAYTIHRLLGVVPHSPFFKHNAENTLPHAVIVVDEASMVDFALMAKLLSALRPDAKIILLGDKDQLSSVEAGAFFGDLCEGSRGRAHRKEFEDAILTIANNHALVPGQETGGGCASDPSALSECVVELTKNYRFSEHSGIGRLSRAIRQGFSAEAMTILSDASRQDVAWIGAQRPEMRLQALGPLILENYGRFLKEEDPFRAYKLFDSFRVLCALRNGPYGVFTINSDIEHILANSGLIDTDTTWYAGRPVMVIGNDYGLGLFNGDIGITMRDSRDSAGNGELKVFFPGETEDAMKSFLPQRLPAHETVFAMTVHKAQGSEFERVLLMFPPLFIPLLSRELLYTGVTRAQKRCEIWGSEDVLRKTIESRIKRTSGLREKLWGKQ